METDFNVTPKPAAAGGLKKIFAKKPVIIFAGVGAVLALIFLFMKSRSAAAAATPTETAYTGVDAAQSAAQGAASNASLYSDVYGLIGQSQDAILTKTETMINDAVTNSEAGINTTIYETQAANASALSAITSQFTDSMSSLTNKYAAMDAAPDAAGTFVTNPVMPAPLPTLDHIPNASENIPDGLYATPGYVPPPPTEFKPILAAQTNFPKTVATTTPTTKK